MSTEAKYKVRCRVSGGVTGTREAYLKQDGKEMEFNTYQEADREARSLTSTMNGPFAKAKFEYWVVPA